jgi:hypothetical protein
LDASNKREWTSRQKIVLVSTGLLAVLAGLANIVYYTRQMSREEERLEGISHELKLRSQVNLSLHDATTSTVTAGNVGEQVFPKTDNYSGWKVQPGNFMAADPSSNSTSRSVPGKD